MRCGLGRLLQPNASPVGLAAGAFAVRKDADKDRLIADRRPRNAGESQPGPVRLPYAPRLRRMRLPPGKGLWLAKRDLSNCFYLFEVEPDRLARQVVGPRLPRAWFEQLDDESLDFAPAAGAWHCPDFAVQGNQQGDELGGLTIVN